MKLLNTLPLWAAATATQISVPGTVPTGASPTVKKEFFGLGIETWSFPNYTNPGNTPNNFSLNLFNALTSRNPGLPIRVGGDQGDNDKYFPTQTIPLQFGPTPTHTNYPGNGFDTCRVGPSFFNGFSLIKDATWVFQVPMLYNDLSNAVDYISAAIGAMPNGSFRALEMGNEPPQYGSLAPTEFGAWGPNAYTKMWLNWTQTLTSQVAALPKNVANFWALSLPCISCSWSIRTAFSDGLASAENTIQAVSLHYYQADASAGMAVLASNYMNHSAIVKGLSSAVSAVNFLNTNASSPVPLVLGEVGPGGCRNVSSNCTIVSDFGVAIWAIDFALHSMLLGIHGVTYHQVENSFEAAWHPVQYDANSPPTVQGLYYGHLFLNELLGSFTGDIKVAELSVSPSTPSIIAYALYNGGKISKIVVINNDIWLTTSSGSRPSTSITISGLGSATSVRVDALRASAADQNSDITWAGQQWTRANGGVPTTSRTNTIVGVTGGSFTLSIEATQVMLVTVL